MTFTRNRDGAQLVPVITFGPFEQERPTRNVVRSLMEADYPLVMFVPAEKRRGIFQMLFYTYAAAKEAAEFFNGPSLYEYSGESIATGAYVIKDGYIVLSSTGLDAGIALRFAVDEGGMRITQNEPAWELRIPYREVIA